MKTVEKMKHVRAFDTCDARMMSDEAQQVYSDCSDEVFVRATHSYEWVGSDCVEEFGYIYEVHENHNIHSGIIAEFDNIADLSAFFEAYIYEEC